MKIVVFGSTGPSGQLIIKSALEKGYDVVAFARNPEKSNIENEKLIFVRGELNDRVAIEKAICGADAVVSILGPLGNDPRNEELISGYENIIAAMMKCGVTRLVAMGTASIADENDRRVIKFRWLVRMVKRIIPGSYKTIVRIGEVIKKSTVDWTIVRVAILTGGNASGKIRAGYYGEKNLGLTISRATLAAFMVEQVNDKTFIKKAPAVSN